MIHNFFLIKFDGKESLSKPAYSLNAIIEVVSHPLTFKILHLVINVKNKAPIDKWAILVIRKKTKNDPQWGLPF